MAICRSRRPVSNPATPLAVSLDVTNSGAREGEEVVQLYVHDNEPKIDRPVRELKGFAKVPLKPGETKNVRLTVRARDLAYFDVAGHQWKADPGMYEVGVGASSRDIRQKAPLRLETAFTESVYESPQASPAPAPSAVSPPRQTD